MNFLKTLFWVVVTAVAVVFSVNNWSPIFPVQLWGGFVADTHAGCPEPLRSGQPRVHGTSR